MPLTSALLATIQHRLAALYETPIEQQITDFLITDAGLATTLQPATQVGERQEQVLLRESKDGLDISVYIDATIIRKLDQADPFDHLCGNNLNQYLIALEGVSHFNYIVWNALHQRQVSQLELELQAEVDKFICSMMLLDAQGSARAARGFHRTLFDGATFNPSNSEACDDRYRAANWFAGKYCQRLNQNFPGQHHQPSFIQEVRRFYRLSHHQKIRAIEHA